MFRSKLKHRSSSKRRLLLRMLAKKLSSRRLPLHAQLRIRKNSLKSISPDPRPRVHVVAEVDVAAEAAVAVPAKVKFVLMERAVEVAVNAVEAVVMVNAAVAVVMVNAVEAVVMVNAAEAVVMASAVEAVVMVNAAVKDAVKAVVADVHELP